MSNRREAILGAVRAAWNRSVGARSALPEIYVKRPPVTLDLGVAPKGEASIVRAVLENVEVEALTGIGRLMREHDTSSSPWLTISLRPDEARLSLTEPKGECVISLRNGCDAFIVGWALPVFQHGLTGYDPARELPELLSAGAGEYWYLREGAPLPGALRRADAVYACFFGNYEERALERMQVEVERLSAAMPSGANFIFNTVLHPAHDPAVLLTAFTR